MEQEVIAFLGSLPLFSGVSRALLESIPEAEGFSVETFSAGSYVMRRGDTARRLGILMSGAAEVEKHKGDTRMLVNILRRGDITGASTLFLPQGAAVNALYTRQGCTLLYISEALLLSLMRQSFTLAENYMRYLTGRVHFLDSRMESLAAPTACGALYSHILQNASDGLFCPQSSMAALATTLSLSRASLYRALDALESTGAVRREGKQIRIL